MMSASTFRLLLLAASVGPSCQFSVLPGSFRVRSPLPAAPRTAQPVNVQATSMRRVKEQLLRDLEAPTERREPDGPAESDPAAGLALAACRAGDARKALSVSALRVSHLTSATSFFVSMVGRSKAQINAIVKNVEDELKDEFGRTASRQGKAMSGWVCLDYDNIVVNVFSEAQQQFYGIEKYWAAAQVLDLSDVLLPSAPEATVDEAAASDDDVDDWELGDDWALGDWSLDDDDDEGDDFQVDAAAAAAAAAAGPAASAASSAAEAVPFDFSLAPKDDDEEMRLQAELDAALLDGDEDYDDDDDDMFAEFEGPGLGGGEDESPFEIIVATPEEEEAAAAAVAARMAEAGALEEEDDGEGDDWALGDERLIELVQRAETEPAEEAVPSWRKMMEADGFSEEDIEAELALDAEEEDEVDLA